MRRRHSICHVTDALNRRLWPLKLDNVFRYAKATLLPSNAIMHLYVLAANDFVPEVTTIAIIRQLSVHDLYKQLHVVIADVTKDYIGLFEPPLHVVKRLMVTRRALCILSYRGYSQVVCMFSNALVFFHDSSVVLAS